MILLDWKKAFDKINHGRLIQALERLNVPVKLLNLIKDIYRNPLFRVKHGEQKSDFLKQETGIRQGCPLSPYLFVLVMGVMFWDIKQVLHTPAQREPIPGIHFSEILYADDTLIFGRHTPSINRLLKEIQRHSAYYNLKLNFDKCVNLTLNRKQSTLKFEDGTNVPRKTKATYLGTILTDSAEFRTEVNNRMADATTAANKLKLFWNKADTTMKWKLQAFNAIVRSKLMYGLETIQLPQVILNRLDAFQMKQTRRILHIPPTFEDRSMSNKKVIEKIENEHNMWFTRLSDFWKNRNLNSLDMLSEPHQMTHLKKWSLNSTQQFSPEPFSNGGGGHQKKIGQKSPSRMYLITMKKKVKIGTSNTE